MPGASSLIADLKTGIVRVLIIDDDLDICNGLKDILQDAGYLVETANYAADGRHRLTIETYSILIVDYSLPDANGIEIAQGVQSQYPWVQTILMTGHDRVEISANHENSPLLGAFLRKPIDVQTILSVMEQLLHRQCDHFQVARFTPHLDGVPPPVLASPEAVPPKAAPESERRESDYERNTHAIPMVMSALLIGMAAGWYGHVFLGHPVVVETPVIVPSQPPLPQENQVPSKPLPPVPPAMSAPVEARVVKTPIKKPVIATPTPPVPSEQPVIDFNQQLVSSDPNLRIRAAKALLKASPKHEEAIVVLLALMEDSENSRRLAAIEALSASGVATPAFIKTLAQALQDSDPSVGYAAATALAHAGDAAITVLPGLIDALAWTSGARVSVGKASREAVIGLGKAAVPALIEGLSNLNIRYEVVEALGAIGPAAQDAIPALTALENDPQVGFAVMKANALIQPQPK